MERSTQLLGAAAHLRNGAGQSLQLVLEGRDDMLLLRHCEFPQPKRPVM